MIEQLHPDVTAAGARVAIFDFDGTISLIRSGWVEVMVPMMVGALADLKTGESETELTSLVEDFVARLTGKQTIYQMIELADQIRRRGGTPEDPLVYKRRYLSLLDRKIEDRIAYLRGGGSPESYLVPGTRALLEALRDRGLRMYLASGTDQDYMRTEADLLDVSRYFDGGVFGALDDYKSFSKKLLISNIISRAECSGEELLGFGDGYVEIQNVKEAGGVAVGVASDEPECRVVDHWKRQRLAGVGADFIVPNFLECDNLLDILFAAPVNAQ